MRDNPATHAVVITDSGNSQSREDLFALLPRENRRTFNQLLPAGARGILIGGTGNYDLFIEHEMEPGRVIPYYQIAGGVIHPICPGTIVNNIRYTTDAPNITVVY